LLNEFAKSSEVHIEVHGFVSALFDEHYCNNYKIRQDRSLL